MFSRSRAIRSCGGSKATSPSTRRSGARSSARTRTLRIASSTSLWPDDAAMTLRVLRWAVIAICVVGIAGMIIGSIADNNNGVVVTFGLITAVSIIVLMAVATTARSLEAKQSAAAEVDEALAEEIETKVQAL